jgi:uncharacterized protein with von Willebrand factor type A (vWA) domain
VSFLVHNLLHFVRLLHAIGLDVHPGRVPDLTRALERVDLGRRADVYFTLETLLVHRREDLAPFAEAFRVFWRRPPNEWSTGDLRALGERRRFGKPQEVPPAVDQGPADSPEADIPAVAIERVAPLSYSPQDISRVKDFAEFTEDELRRAQAVVRELEWSPGERRSRRWTVGSGRQPDPRRIVRRNMRYGGEPIEVPRRSRRMKRRPLVLVCDVSGSMERYGRMLLNLGASLASASYRVESFVFATRLSRLTRELAGDQTSGLAVKVPRVVSDWGGGTRIGSALRQLNVEWGRRVLRRSAVVLLISDGWDRGDPEQLAAEMSRLHRSCHRLIWLNPLLGSPDYQPLTRGMQAALPFVDDFLPVHNLASLEALAAHLGRLPARRSRHSGRGGLSARPS